MLTFCCATIVSYFHLLLLNFSGAKSGHLQILVSLLQYLYVLYFFFLILLDNGNRKILNNSANRAYFFPHS